MLRRIEFVQWTSDPFHGQANKLPTGHRARGRESSVNAVADGRELFFTDAPRREQDQARGLTNNTRSEGDGSPEQQQECVKQRTNRRPFAARTCRRKTL